MEPRAATALETTGGIFDIWSLQRPPRYLNECAIRALCRSAYLGETTSVCRVLGRYRMFVDTGDVGLSTHLLMDGYWEIWTTEAMLKYVRPGMTAIDIGANLGYFTLLIADLVGPSGRVDAFEPNPAIADRLRRSVAVNGFGSTTTVHNLALGDAEAAITVIVPPGEPKNAHVVPWRSDVGGASVAQKRLDSFADLKPDFIKIDVEGAEESIWRGMAGMLAHGQPMTVFLEFTAARYSDPGRFLDEILAHGFALSVIDTSLGVLLTTRAEVLAGPPTEDQMLVLTR